MVLAQNASADDNLTPVYYAIAILALIIGGLWALKKNNDKAKQELIQRGIKEQQLVDKLDANTQAAEKNTASLSKLGDKFDAFSSTIDKRMTLGEYRINKLEEVTFNGKSPKGGA
jgi:FtsZ-interacting cell division protein ZipA